MRNKKDKKIRKDRKITMRERKKEKREEKTRKNTHIATTTTKIRHKETSFLFDCVWTMISAYSTKGMNDMLVVVSDCQVRCHNLCHISLAWLSCLDCCNSLLSGTAHRQTCSARFIIKTPKRTQASPFLVKVHLSTKTNPCAMMYSQNLPRLSCVICLNCTPVQFFDFLCWHLHRSG